MGRIPCCEKENVKRGQWTPEEDNKLSSYISQHGTRRTDNDVKNHWNTKLKKKLSGMGIDPVTHKPFSHLMAEIATLAPPQVGNLAEAALGCFKDEMLHLLTKKRVEVHLQQSGAAHNPSANTLITGKHDEKEDTIERIKLGLSKAIQEPNTLPLSKHWGSNIGASASFADACCAFPSGFHCGPSSFGNEEDESPWNQSTCTGSTCTAGDQNCRLNGKNKEDNGEESEGGKETRDGSSIFNSDCVLWDLPSDDLINPMV
ncbi:hypothetical protein LguiA_023472 [Lonicera macranthoides]